jgi:hypothetical protein
MEDPAVIAARVTSTAKDIVDQARAVAKVTVAQADDVDNFTAAMLVDAYTKSVNIALSGGIQLAKDVLGVDEPTGPTQAPDPDAEGRRLVADAMEAITRRMIRQSGVVAQETANKLDSNPNSPSTWAQSMVKFADIVLLGGIELAETALIGPGPFETAVRRSPVYAATGAGTRQLKVVEPAGIARPGTVDPIPAARLSFHVPKGDPDDDNDLQPDDDTKLSNGILSAGDTEFYLAVHPAGMISGLYVGEVEVVDLGTKAVVDTVQVEINL